MCILSDLQVVLAGFPLSGLEAANAVPDERYVTGRFFKGDRGCLVFHLSQGRIASRHALKIYCDGNRKFSAACRRVIAAYDAGADIFKGPGYTSFYPRVNPGETLSLAQFREALRDAIGRRKVEADRLKPSRVRVRRKNLAHAGTNVLSSAN